MNQFKTTLSPLVQGRSSPSFLNVLKVKLREGNEQRMHHGSFLVSAYRQSEAAHTGTLLRDTPCAEAGDPQHPLLIYGFYHIWPTQLGLHAMVSSIRGYPFRYCHSSMAKVQLHSTPSSLLLENQHPHHKSTAISTAMPSLSYTLSSIQLVIPTLHLRET